MKDDQKDQDLLKVGREHRAIQSSESAIIPKSDAAPSFTKGPWAIAYNEPRPWNPKRRPSHIVDADGNPIIVCGVTATSWGNPEIDANARLIAAAPALYEALNANSHILHNESGDHRPDFITLEHCQQAPCVWARTVLALVESGGK